MGILDRLYGLGARVRDVLGFNSENRVPRPDEVKETEMRRKQQLWRNMYQGKAPWIRKRVRSLQIPALVASEVSRLVTLDVVTKVEDSFLDEVFRREVMGNLRTQVEYGLAFGGLILKPYTRNKKLYVDFAQPDEFLILNATKDGTILEILFKDYQKVRQQYYVRVEYHKWDNRSGAYCISNRVYMSDEMGGVGLEMPNLEIVPEWSGMERDFELRNIAAPLFGYFKPALSNHIDTKSAEGVSIFSRGEDAIRRADEQLSGLLREFRVKEAKQYVNELAVKGSGPLPHLEDDYYIKLRDGTSGFFETYSPQIHSKEFLETLDEYKREVEMAVGLAFGTLSNPASVARTATEVRESKDRTAVLVSETQANLQEAFEATVYALSVWWKYPSKPQEYAVTTTWDESLWVNRAAEAESMRLDVREGYIKPIYYLMKKYGWTEEEALERMPDGDDLLLLTHEGR